MSATKLAAVKRVADAVLLEGYALYPYRPTSAKNRYRWTFGVLAPRTWSEAGGCEPWWLEAQIPIEGSRATVRGTLRFLRVVVRTVELRDDDEEQETWREVERYDADGQTYVAWEEGELTEIDFAVGDQVFALEPIERCEVIAEDARVVWRSPPIAGRIRVRIDRTDGAALARATVRVENFTAFTHPEAPRAEAVRAAMVSTHMVLSCDAGEFVSLLDPPDHALAVAASCANVGTHPVLAGSPRQRGLALASPIILYDHPAIAPESPGDFFDAGEIDELLALRTRTLTPEEKALARATDRRTAEIVDRVDALSDADLARLHGAVRERHRPGTRVRLRPDLRRRRTDAQDILYAGRTATIEAVKLDVDGREYLAVTLDDDPAVEMHRAKGRFHYYYADEVEPLGPEPEEEA